MKRYLTLIPIVLLAALLLSAYALDISACVIPQDCEIPSDAIGVWQIPIDNISVPVYEGNDAQAIVDAENSAYYVDRMILDHAKSSHGTWYMKNLYVDEVGFWITSDGTEEYRCYAILRATTDGYYYYVDGERITAQADEIWNVCCANESGSEVYIAMFRFYATY